MRITSALFLVLLTVGGCYKALFAGTQGIGGPLKYLSSCEIDLNGDNEVDIALLVETVRGRELIVLLRVSEGYKAFVFGSIGEMGQLECRFGKTVRETQASPHFGKEHKTPGAYIEIIYPEASSLAYV